MSKEKQVKARLKVWLLRGNSITALQAWKKFKTNRLAVYIQRLRDDGLNIETRTVQFGEDRYAQYTLKP